MQAAEIQLNAYLEKLEAQLAELPPVRRAEIRSETREHLEAMIAARRADGMSESDAWHSALGAFGEAQAIGQELAREWERAPRFETEGHPLCKRDIQLKFVRLLALILPGYVALLSLITWLQPRHLDGLFFLILAPGSFWFNVWRARRYGIIITRTNLFGYLFAFVIMLVVGLQRDFHDHITGTPLAGFLDAWFGPAIAVASLLLLLLAKREAKTTFPWRNSPLYAQNPIGAEEEYRLSPLLGLVAGTSMGCIGLLWMGWLFFGFVAGVGLCLVEITFALLCGRWIKGRTA